jgi:hypothetical protein
MFCHLERKNNRNQFNNWKKSSMKNYTCSCFFWGRFSSLVKILLKQVKMAEIHHPPTPLSNTETQIINKSLVYLTEISNGAYEAKLYISLSWCT